MNDVYKTFRVGVATGGFDPVHSGHIAYLTEASKKCDILYVGVNSEDWLVRKKGKSFMSEAERMTIVSNLKPVTKAFLMKDDDGTAIDFIETTLTKFRASTKIIFMNGGDRTNTTTPEYTHFHNHPRIEFLWGIGGEDKKNSSSTILKKWKKHLTTPS